MKNWILIYFIIINFITFILYGIDKYKSKKTKWRISEQTLILFGLFGGSLGGIIGMKAFHHKTKKLRFYVYNFIFIILLIYIFYCVI